MSNIKDQIITLVKQRHHSHKVALEQEKDPRSKHAVDLIARIREDSQLIELIDSLPEEDLYAEVGDTEEDYIKRSMAKVNECRKMICKDSLQVHETCKENGNSFTSLEEAVEKHINEAMFKWSYDDEDGIEQYVHDAFIAGAKWMRKKDVEDMYMSDNRHFLKCYEQGKVDMKVEMMKKVKYGVVCKNGERDEEDVWIELNPGSLPDYKDTDPIDFIIVKQ